MSLKSKWIEQDSDSDFENDNEKLVDSNSLTCKNEKLAITKVETKADELLSRVSRPAYIFPHCENKALPTSSSSVVASSSSTVSGTRDVKFDEESASLQDRVTTYDAKSSYQIPPSNLNKTKPLSSDKGTSDNQFHKKDKESAKDRVKRQRLSGQSGIGSEFKTWRSDEEMRRRQQYD